MDDTLQDEMDDLRAFQADALRAALEGIDRINTALNRGEENLTHDELADLLVDTLILLEGIVGADEVEDEDDDADVVLLLLNGGGEE